MSGANKTRTQRRMEKRQAIILLVLVLAVSLVSFTLGVMIGRRGAERELAYQQSQAEKVLVAESSATTQPAGTERGPTVDVSSPTVAGQPVTEAQGDDPKLSFYDDLAKENVPLGSGINVAPSKEKNAVEPPPIPLPEQPIVKKTPEKETVVAAVTPPPVAKPAPTASAQGMPAAVSGGSHAVQVGSFSAEKDATALKQKLVKFNYPAFVVEADLGAKGRWYRVRVGPYSDAEQAKAAQIFLEEHEKIKGFVSRR